MAYELPLLISLGVFKSWKSLNPALGGKISFKEDKHEETISRKEIFVMITNEFYDLDYDPERNQINWKVKGYWASVNEVPNMEKDWKSMLAKARKPGFNILADLTEMKVTPHDVQELHAKIQQQIIQSGVQKIATITTSTMTRISVKNIGSVSGITQMASDFNDPMKAQAWLGET